MKKIKNIVFPLVVLVIVIVASGYNKSASEVVKNETSFVLQNNYKQMINLFVTHGHCSTPFSGQVDDLKIDIKQRFDKGNPLEDMKISFDINPNSFNVCSLDDDLTEKIKTPGLFIGKENEKITFKSTQIYTMGLDWYQVNGIMSIKGVEKEVKLLATGIRNSKDSEAHALVIEGQMNLLDWGIDYDLIVNGKSDRVPTKWMYLNMKVDVLSFF